jgi:hypothetical protein
VNREITVRRRICFDTVMAVSGYPTKINDLITPSISQMLIPLFS